MQTAANDAERLTRRSDTQIALVAAALGILVGLAVGLFKGDVAGIRATLGNLIAPWLIVGFYCAKHCRNLSLLALSTWGGTALSVLTFYTTQGVLWGMVTRYSWKYDTFWVLVGSTICSVLAIMVRISLQDREGYITCWALVSAFFAVAYAGYWIYLGLFLSDAQVITCLTAALVFIVFSIAYGAHLRRVKTVRTARVFPN